MPFQLLLLVGSFLVLALSARMLVVSLAHLAHFLRWREFVLVFFVTGIGAALPNLFVGISSAFRGIPELSFADVMGNNVIVFTLVTGLAALFGRELSVESRVVKRSSVFLFLAAVLPLLLILDGTLSRGDGVALLFAFFFYSAWLFSKRHLFDTTIPAEQRKKRSILERLSLFLKSVGGILLSLPLLILSADSLVRSSVFFAEYFAVSLIFLGIFVVALGTSLPELFFSTIAARRGQSWLALGEIMGEVIIISTFVLGIVAVIRPIEILDFSSFAVARLFLLLVASLFLLFVQTGKRITKSEGVVLLLLYVAFVLVEFFTRMREVV